MHVGSPAHSPRQALSHAVGVVDEGDVGFTASHFPSLTLEHAESSVVFATNWRSEAHVLSGETTHNAPTHAHTSSVLVPLSRSPQCGKASGSSVTSVHAPIWRQRFVPVVLSALH